MGASPHTGLLWALEMLGWFDRLMPRVASSLAKLAQFDEKMPNRPGRLANRPKASLNGLLCVALPQTLASADERIREMERRLEETPDIGFALLGEQFSSIGDIVLSSQACKPELRPIAIPTLEEQSERTSKESFQVLSAYIDMALNHAKHDANRWAYLLTNIPMHMDIELTNRILDRFEGSMSEIRDENATVWTAIRHILHRIGPRLDELPERESSSPDMSAIREKWQRLYSAYEPSDLALRYAWLFVRGAELPDPIGDWNAEQKELAKLISSAVEELGRQPGRDQILTSLAEKVTETNVLGLALGMATFAKDVDGLLIDRTPPACFAPQLPAFIVIRSRVEAQHWLENVVRALLTQGRRNNVEATLNALPSNTQTWDLVDALGQDIANSYWNKHQYVFGEHPTEVWDRAIRNLLDAKNSIYALRNASHAKDQISSHMIIEVLEVFLADRAETSELLQDSMFSWDLAQLMDRLEVEPDADAKYGALLARAELVYAQSTHGSTRPMRHLSSVLASDVGQFVDLVNRADSAAASVLYAWDGYPGLGCPAAEREDILLTWSLDALNRLTLPERPDRGVGEIARVLARTEDAEDGFWPCFAARRLLESEKFPSLSDAMRTAKWNLRGWTTRTLGEGGKQERILVADYRRAAKELRLTWPRTSDMLDALAESYERDAMREDEHARATMRKEGAEPEDFENRPRKLAPSPKRRVLSPGLVRLEGIELTDFALFKSLAITIRPPTDRGQWILLLGENGRGKSTLLRAIALALGGPNVAQAAVSQYRAPLIRIGQSAASCVVDCGGERFSTHLTNDGTGELATYEPLSGARPSVFAYGCYRGSALGGSEAADITSRFSDVAMLFSQSARLHSAAGWLKGLKLRALQDPKYDAIFSTVVRQLCDLLPDVERLDVAENEVWAVSPRLGGRVPLAALSDGYLTTLGWTTDLVARWLHWAEQIDVDSDGNFFARMEGLVLIDEIDLHLHPAWQRRVVRTLKDVFPRLSFVATTHNPMALLGADSSEILVLRDAIDGTGQIEAKTFDLPPGIRADRILTGEWFGLPYAVNDDTIALIEAHQQLLLHQVPPQAPERLELEERLAARYSSYADTSLDRMALDVAAELMRERQPKSPEEREVLRRQLKERVRQRLAELEHQSGSKS